MKGPEETAEVGAGNAKKSLRRSCRPAAGEEGKIKEGDGLDGSEGLVTGEKGLSTEA